MASLEISSAQYSIAGIKSENEDACGIHVPDEPLLTTKGIAVAIADGVSSSDAGKRASEACVKGFLSDYFSSPESWTVKTSAQKVLSALNRWLHAQGQREFGHAQGMITTFSAVVIKSNTAHIFHVGDTRIYRLRDNELEQLTHDHRIVLDKDKSYLSRAMGIDLRLDIDVRTVTVETGDIFLLVCDGVYEFLADGLLRKHIKDNDKDLDKACKSIVDHAVTNKSNDNLTCQLVRVDRLPSENEKEFYNKLIELPFPPPLEPGMILDGYKILRQLFSNKRTEVYLAKDTADESTVIMKAPSLNYDDDAEYINRFLHEEWAGKRIKNSNVVQIIESRQKRTALYYITEYVEGQTLRQWMKDHPLPSIISVRNYAEQIAHGLRAFHRLEMIHQDLKPENILLDKHDSLKIIDFGSTKIAGIEEISTPLMQNNLLGTINYTAPEYHIGDPGSHRSDIFSLGVIVYEMLTGELPFTKELSARNLGRATYRSVKFFRPDIPVWVDKTIEKAVNINPEMRFDKLSEFTYALSHPDSTLINQDYVPLIKRNPVKFWKSLSIILLIINLVFIYMLVK
ncbi:MAG: bifunctional protein-serine/threonine kinase/phosphatase [Gammaproteobacteria bacterium]|nr:bifunctional protein-serine/threonine kinase/phosphatase [Gammaproteobacteria bacterium]